MKNFLKYSITAGAVMAFAASVNAIPTLVVTDGAGISAIQTSASGVVTISTSDGDWSVVVATGISQPPVLGVGTATAPVMDLTIQATYIGSGGGSPLIVSWANDGFGPTVGNFVGTLTGHGFTGSPPPITWNLYYGAGSQLPTTGSPLPGGVTTVGSTFSLAGPIPTLTSPGVNLAAPYTLGEELILGGGAGVSYSIDASINTVPDGGMTLVLLGSALSALALLKKKLV